MKTLGFRYEIAFRRSHMQPICRISLVGPARAVDVRVLVDSGATISVFPQKAAEDAGIELTSYKNYPLQFGAGGVQSGKRAKVTLRLGERRWATDVVFVESLPFAYGLLGRHGVFSRFNEVVFLEKRSTPRMEFRW